MTSEYASLKHSKDLAELFPDAEWWWVSFISGSSNGETFWELVPKHRLCDVGDSTTKYPAITIQMALDVVPNKIKDLLVINWSEKYGWGCIASASFPDGFNIWCEAEDKSLPNALCKMLIFLRKENLLNAIKTN